MNYFNRDLELEIISALIENPINIKSSMKILNGEEFYFDENRTIYFTLVEMFTKGEKINKGQLMIRLINGNKLKDVKEKINFPDNSGSADTTTHNLYRLKDLKALQKANLFSLGLGDKIKDGDIDDVKSYITKGHDDLINSSGSLSRISDNKQVLANTLLQIEESMKRKELGFSGVRTGFKSIDEEYGGLQNDELVIIAGRPGMAKTIVGLEIAKNASESGTKTLFVSLEMAKESLMIRMISSVMDNVRYSKMKNGNIRPETLANIHKEAVHKLNNLPIFWYDDEDRDISIVLQEIEKLVFIEGVGLVVIDYMQLLENKLIKGGDSAEYATVTSISKALKKTQKKLKIPFVALAQLSRACEARKGDERKPKISDLRSTGQIEQDASIIIGLFRRDYYALQIDKYAFLDYELSMNVLKARDGRTMEHTLFIDVSKSKIRDTKEQLNLESLDIKTLDEKIQQTHDYAHSKALDQIGGADSFLTEKTVAKF
jgi:replicative DNA helicase